MEKNNGLCMGIRYKAKFGELMNIYEMFVAGRLAGSQRVYRTITH